MLEELWRDRLEIPPCELDAAASDMSQKKQVVTQLKKANMHKRDAIRQGAAAFDAGVARGLERKAGLAAALQRASVANAEAGELRAKLTNHAAATVRAREQTGHAHLALETTKAECDALTQRLASLHKQAAAETQEANALRAQGDSLAVQLAATDAQREAAAESAGECTSWYETVNAVVKRLAGIAGVQLDEDHRLRYEIEAPPANRGLRPAACGGLVARLDGPGGPLLGARIEPPLVADISDVDARAARLNSVTMLVREVQHRVLAPLPPPAGESASTSLAALEPLLTRPRGGLASTPSKQYPTSAGGSATREGDVGAASVLSAPVPPVPITSRPAADELEIALARSPLTVAPLTATAGAATAATCFDAPAPTVSASRTTGGCIPGERSGCTEDRLAGMACAFQDQCCAPVSTTSPGLSSPSIDANVANAERGANTALGLPIRLGAVDRNALMSMGIARHKEERRKSRKSFSRSVAHPRSPCARAARAGFAVDPRAVIAEVAATDNHTAGPMREFTAVDVLGHSRMALLSDGRVVDATGALRAYIEPDGTVGDPALEYVGEVTAPNANTIGFVTDKFDELVAEVDYGRGLIRDAKGSTIAVLTKTGEVSCHNGSRCGTLEGFGYAMLRSAAAYLTLVDDGFVSGN